MTVFDLTRFSIFKSGILPIYSCVCFWLSCFLSTTQKVILDCDKYNYCKSTQIGLSIENYENC